MGRWASFGFGFLFCWAANASELPLAEGDEVFLIALNSNLLAELVNKPILERTPISDQVGRTRVAGCSETRGTVTAGPMLSKEGMAFQLILDSNTSISTTALTDGVKELEEPGKSHPEIAATFGNHVSTFAKTTKGITLREDGFAFWDASTAANSVMDGMTVPRVQAQGLVPGRRFELGPNGRRRINPDGPDALPIPGAAIFPRVRLGKAQEQVTQAVMQQRAKMESDATKRVSESLNTQFEKTVKEAIQPINLKYLTYVYEPFIKKALLGGRLQTGSDGGWMAIRGTRGGQLMPLFPSSIPGLPGSLGEPILMRMHPEFIERIAEMRFGGTLMTEVEVAEMMGYTQPDDETIENVLGQGEKEVEFVFDEKLPIRIQFIDSKIRLTLRMAEASTLGKTLNNVQITRDIVIDRGNAAIRLHMQPPEAAVFYDGKLVPGELGKHITYRFGRLLKKEPVEVSKNTFFKSVKPMAVKSITTEDNRLTVGLAPVAQVGGMQ